MIDKIGKHNYGKPIIQKLFPEYNSVEIGNFNSFSFNIQFLFLGNHDTKKVSTYGFIDFGLIPNKKNEPNINFVETKIIVGNDIWFGANSIVLQKSIIGNGAVIGANSVVRGIVEPYAIVIGNPAQEIRKRFSNNIIKELLKIKWWDWPDDKIEQNALLLKEYINEEMLERLRRAK